MLARTIALVAAVGAITSTAAVAQEVAVAGSHAGSAIAVRYQYDSEGRLVKKIGLDGIRQYIHDEGRLLVEYDEHGVQIARYTYGHDRLLSLSHLIEGARFYHLDGLGSVTALSDPSGAVTSRLHLDAWGLFKNPTELNGSANRFAFTSYQFERETGLYYASARFYDPTIGRLTSQDSYLGEATDPSSLHRFGYGLNNPTRFVDPTGHQSIGAEFCRAHGCSSQISRQVDPLFALTEKLQIAEDAVVQKAGEVGMGVSVAAANTLKAINSPGHLTPDAQREYYIQPETPTERVAAEVADLALLAAPLLSKSSPKGPARANAARVTATHEELVVPLQEAMTRGESFTILEDGALMARSGSGGSQVLDQAVVPSSTVAERAMLPAARTAEQWRNTPGRAFGMDLPTIAEGQRWLRGSGADAGRFPGQIAEKLHGRSFETFKDFREAAWREVAADPVLSKQFGPNSRREMQAGRAPFAPGSGRVGGRIKYEIDHLIEIKDGGGVYDLNNLVIRTPVNHLGKTP